MGLCAQPPSPRLNARFTPKRALPRLGVSPRPSQVEKDGESGFIPESCTYQEVFGVPLDVLADRDSRPGGVPKVVEQILARLVALDATTIEGIFRIPGAPALPPAHNVVPWRTTGCVARPGLFTPCAFDGLGDEGRCRALKESLNAVSKAFPCKTYPHTCLTGTDLHIHCACIWPVSQGGVCAMTDRPAQGVDGADSLSASPFDW